jgi:hypothetical protein
LVRKQQKQAIRKLHLNLPEHLHQKLRVACAYEDVTMQDFVANLIEKAVTHALTPKRKVKVPRAT